MERPTIGITIGDNKYNASTYVSVNDRILILDSFKEHEDIDYRQILLSILLNHLEDYKESSVEPDQITSKDLLAFIDAYVNSSEELKTLYLECMGENPEEACISSLYRYIKNNHALALQEIKSLISVVDYDKAALQDAISCYYESNPFVVNLGKELSSVYQTIVFPSMENLVKQCKETMFALAPDWSELAHSFADTFNSIAKTIRVPEWSPDFRNQLEAAFTEWGNYGWTLPPTADITLFYKKPSNASEAYSLVKPYIDDEAMSFVFSELQKKEYINQNDLREAIDDYKDKRYKSSVMLLFSIIDARIISLQAINPKKFRLTGKKGAKELFDRAREAKSDTTFLLDLLHNACVMSSMNAIFESGRNFVTQPKIINRNFVDHGMLHRKVSLKDCKMVFLLVFNYMLSVEWIMGE